MTGEEKQNLAEKLDRIDDILRDGFIRDPLHYSFTDDTQLNSDVIGDGKERMVEGTDSLELIAQEVSACTACHLAAGRNRVVPGEGVSHPLVVVVGEGPGAEEDRIGRPFVGPAGHLLDKMLASIGLSRDENCYLANVVKCRPPGNRDPEKDEIAACASFLNRQLDLLAPRFILSMGRVASQTLLKTTEGIGKLRGKVYTYHGIPLLPTFHPSALLRNEELKRPAWDDLKKLRSLLQEEGSIDRDEDS